MDGISFGILDTVGFLLVPLVLFMPVAWFGVYFVAELFRLREQNPPRFVQGEPKSEVRGLDRVDVIHLPDDSHQKAA